MSEPLFIERFALPAAPGEGGDLRRRRRGALEKHAPSFTGR